MSRNSVSPREIGGVMSWWMIQLDVETTEMIRDEDFLEKRMKKDLEEDNKL